MTHIPPGASGDAPLASAHGKGCNLPGWPWAMITKVALDRLSRSLHSDVCESDRCRDAVAYSRISDRGNRRLRAVPNYPNKMFSNVSAMVSTGPPELQCQSE